MGFNLAFKGLKRVEERKRGRKKEKRKRRQRKRSWKHHIYCKQRENFMAMKIRRE